MAMRDYFRGCACVVCRARVETEVVWIFSCRRCARIVDFTSGCRRGILMRQPQLAVSAYVIQEHFPEVTLLGLDGGHLYVEALSGPCARCCSTSISSTLVNLPLVYQQTHQRVLSRRLSIISFCLVLLGLSALLVREKFLH